MKRGKFYLSNKYLEQISHIQKIYPHHDYISSHHPAFAFVQTRGQRGSARRMRGTSGETLLELRPRPLLHYPKGKGFGVILLCFSNTAAEHCWRRQLPFSLVRCFSNTFIRVSTQYDFITISVLFLLSIL